MSEPHPRAEDLSRLDRDAFQAALEGIYEHSPWVAERAWERRPFADREALGRALVAVLGEAAHAEQLALIRAHPELAGKAAVRVELTLESTREQAGAGLDQCTPEEFARLQRLNAAYRHKFGFPFVVAVRGLSRQAIIDTCERRLGGTPEEEFSESLRQITRIAALRLEERFGG